MIADALSAPAAVALAVLLYYSARGAGTATGGWHNLHMAAGEPFEIAASGPTGAGVKVELFADLGPLKIAWRDKANPYRVRADAL